MATREELELERLRVLVSPRTGIVRELAPLLKGALDPTPPFTYRAALANFSLSRRADAPHRAGVGTHPTRAVAQVKALAEALEQYCALQPDRGKIVRTRFADIQAHALDPNECVLYSEQQYQMEGFPYSRFSCDTPIEWTRGETLPERDPLLVPAIFTYLCKTWGGWEEYLCLPTSNGLAVGVDSPSALLHGLLEVAERDAFLVAWLTRRPCRQINYRRAGGLVAAIAARYERFGIEVRVVELTTDVPVHVMMAIALDSGGIGPAAVVGLGTNLHPALAIEKSMMEVCQGRPGEAVRLRLDPPGDRLRSVDSVHEMSDHSALFSMPHMLRELDFLIQNESGPHLAPEELPNWSTGSAESDLDFLLSALVSMGSKVAYVDLTTPDIATLGLHVVRVIVTQLQPMHFGYGAERLGGTRLFEVAMKLGYSSRRLQTADLNVAPHPLA